MMEFVFWVDVAILGYVYVGYVLLLWLVSLWRRRAPAELLRANYPSITVLIAAHNEEAHIRAKIEQTLSLHYPADRLEIVVASDSSTDQTDEIVESFVKKDPRVKLVRIWPHNGKTYAQNMAVPECTGDIIVFSDATALYDPMVLQYLACNYADERVAAVSGRYRYADGMHAPSPSSFGSEAFWDFENYIKLLQSQISTLTGCSGCIYSLRRSLYVPLANDACSDLVEPLELVKRGYRVAFEPRALAYEEPTESSLQEFQMRVRVMTRGMRSIFAMRALLNVFAYGWVSFQLFSHKILRWAMPFLLFLLVILSALIDAPWAHYFFLGQLAFYTLGLVSLFAPLHRIWKPLGAPGHVWTVTAAVLTSILRLVKGRTYTTWETARRNDPVNIPKRY